MLVIPAIDIRHGQCVRLFQGKDEQATVYSTNPVEVGVMWAHKGAKRLHVADLDGAFDGKPANIAAAVQMKKDTGLPVQIGGGYRDMESIKAALEAGIDRVILGTVAVYNPELVAEAVETFGPRISVSIDVAEDFVAVSGWKEVSKIRFEDLAKKIVGMGVTELLFTDTRKDGTLSGPNIPAIRRFLSAAAGVPVTASGGVTTVEDVKALRALEPEGLFAAIIGKSLYDKRVRLEDAIAATK